MECKSFLYLPLPFQEEKARWVHKIMLVISEMKECLKWWLNWYKAMASQRTSDGSGQESVCSSLLYLTVAHPMPPGALKTKSWGRFK